jgi:citrate lyase beta subunit
MWSTTARVIIATFAAAPGTGTLKFGGHMIERPHLLEAEQMLVSGTT